MAKQRPETTNEDQTQEDQTSTNAPVINTRAKATADHIVGQTPLAEAALEIFKTRRIAMPNYSADAVAQLAFADAAAFIQEEARIRNGGDIYQAPESVVEPWIMVEVWDPITDEPKRDESGNKIVQKVRGDRDAFAPNLKPDHPINQRHWKSRLALGLEIDPRFQKVAREYQLTLEPSTN